MLDINVLLRCLLNNFNWQVDLNKMFDIENSKATWDGFTYLVEDESFKWHIDNGHSEPYKRELEIVKSYLSDFPECKNIFIDVGAHIGTTALPYSR